MNQYDAIILAKGDYPNSEYSRKVLEQARFVCCCDEAAEEYIRREGKTPDAIVGDGDSLSQKFKARYADIYHEVHEQEFNDLTKATRFCISHQLLDQGVRPLDFKVDAKLRIGYLGATGKREDHTIGNIALMSFYRRELGIEPEMITDYGRFIPCEGRMEFCSFMGQQVSIFNVSCKEIRSERLKWDAYGYKELWQGTLNEALADSFVLDGDGEYIVYLTHQAKGIGI